MSGYISKDRAFTLFNILQHPSLFPAADNSSDQLLCWTQGPCWINRGVRIGVQNTCRQQGDTCFQSLITLDKHRQSLPASGSALKHSRRWGPQPKRQVLAELGAILTVSSPPRPPVHLLALTPGFILKEQWHSGVSRLLGRMDTTMFDALKRERSQEWERSQATPDRARGAGCPTAHVSKEASRGACLFY